LQMKQMTPTTEELDHPHIATILAMKKNEEELFLKKKSFPKSGCKVKVVPHDYSTKEEGNTLILGHLEKHRRFIPTNEGRSRSSELDLNVRLARVKDELQAVRHNQKDKMSILRTVKI
ncbi:hypothetical protein TorRG33x02_225080, partial [Trema orientale]